MHPDAPLRNTMQTSESLDRPPSISGASSPLFAPQARVYAFFSFTKTRVAVRICLFWGLWAVDCLCWAKNSRTEGETTRVELTEWRHFLCLNRNVFCDAYNLRYGGAQFVISEARGPSLAIYRHSEVVRSLLLFEDSIQHAHGQGTENGWPLVGGP